MYLGITIFMNPLGLKHFLLVCIKLHSWLAKQLYLHIKNYRYLVETKSDFIMFNYIFISRYWSLTGQMYNELQHKFQPAVIVNKSRFDKNMVGGH